MLPSHRFFAHVWQQEGRCAYCGTDLREVEVHVDHVIPYAMTGVVLPDEGLVLACKRCNLKKSSRFFGNDQALANFIMDMIEDHGTYHEGWPDGAEAYWSRCLAKNNEENS